MCWTRLLEIAFFGWFHVLDSLIRICLFGARFMCWTRLLEIAFWGSYDVLDSLI